jgi:hypothetical protein
MGFVIFKSQIQKPQTKSGGVSEILSERSVKLLKNFSKSVIHNEAKQQEEELLGSHSVFCLLISVVSNNGTEPCQENRTRHLTAISNCLDWTILLLHSRSRRLTSHSSKTGIRIDSLRVLPSNNWQRQD